MTVQSEGSGRPDIHRSGGLVSGVTGLVCVAAIIVLGIADPTMGFPLWGYALGLLAGVLVWAMLIRPCVRLSDDAVELRNPFGSTHLPYGRITKVAITQVTRIKAGERTFIGSGFGRSRRTIRSDSRLGESARPGDYSVGWLVEQRIERRVADAGARSGDAAPEVVVEWARIELGLAVGLALLTVVLILVG